MAEVAHRRVGDVGVLEPELAEQAVVELDRLHELGEVLAGAEVVALAADDEHLHVVVDVGLVQQVGVAEPHGDRRRVEVVGPVQREGGDLGRRVLLVADPVRVVVLELVGHVSRRGRGSACTLVLTIFTASSGPTASTTLASDCSE